MAKMSGTPWKSTSKKSKPRVERLELVDPRKLEEHPIRKAAISAEARRLIWLNIPDVLYEAIIRPARVALGEGCTLTQFYQFREQLRLDYAKAHPEVAIYEGHGHFEPCEGSYLRFAKDENLKVQAAIDLACREQGLGPMRPCTKDEASQTLIIQLDGQSVEVDVQPVADLHS